MPNHSRIENQDIEFPDTFNAFVKMRFVPFKRGKTLTLNSVNMLHRQFCRDEVSDIRFFEKQMLTLYNSL